MKKNILILAIIFLIVLVSSIKIFSENGESENKLKYHAFFEIISFLDKPSTTISMRYNDFDKATKFYNGYLNLVSPGYKAARQEHFNPYSFPLINLKDSNYCIREIDLVKSAIWFEDDFGSLYDSFLEKDGEYDFFVEMYVDKELGYNKIERLMYRSNKIKYWKGDISQNRNYLVNTDLKLDINVISKEKHGAWEFVVQNKCEKTYEISSLLSENNRVYMQRFDSRVKMLELSSKRQPSIFIKPAESVTFKLNVLELPECKSFIQEDGIYCIFWELFPIQPNEMTIRHVSRDIYFIKEKDSIKQIEMPVNLKIMPFWDPGKMSTDLVFHLINNTKERLYTYPVGVNSNKIVIVKPDGQVTEYSVSQDPGKYLSIAPEKEMLWEYDISKIEKFDELTKEPGIYQVYWKLKCEQEEEGKKETRKQKEYQSEPLLFLREPIEEQNKPGNSDKQKSE